MKHHVLALAVVAALAGCSSVKVDETPVVDQTASTSASGQTGAAVDQGAASAADLSKNQVKAPAATERVYFDFDKFDIKPEFQSVIEAHARYLKADANRKVSLEGHADERGGREYNLALGQKRAEAVRRALGLLGVKDSQLEAVSFGKEKPAVQGHNEEAWSKNRRVEFAYK